MSDSQSDSDGDSSSSGPSRWYQVRRHALHDAAEAGDIEQMKKLLNPALVEEEKAQELEKKKEEKEKEEERDGMDVDAPGQDLEEEEKMRRRRDLAALAGEEGEEEDDDDDEDDESYHEEDDEEEDDDDEDEEDEEERGDDQDSDDDDDDDDEEEEEEEEDKSSSADEGGAKPSCPPPADINEKDNFGCTPLHVALHARQLEATGFLLEQGADHSKRTEGSSPLHTATSLGAITAHRAFVIQAVELLIKHGADVNAKDDVGQTAMHIAASHGHMELIHILLRAGAEASVNSRDRQQQRPLHLGARQGHVEVVKALVEAGSDVLGQNQMGSTALHYACERGHWDVVRFLAPLAGKNEGTEEKVPLVSVADKRGRTAGQVALRVRVSIPADVRQLLGIAEGEVAVIGDSKTVLFMDPSFFRHHTCKPISRQSVGLPPENVTRIKVLLDEETGILRSSEFSSVHWENTAPPAELADVLRVHEYSYVQRLRERCEMIPDVPQAIGHLDGDTAISYGTWEASLRAAGAACKAVDCVVQGANRNAFCVIRPPGHHAGSRGVVYEKDGTGSHGFCLLNNVAIAAAYARNMYRHKGVRRVAIVDFDVHHGNGTEEIVENLCPWEEVVQSNLPWCESATFRSIKYQPWLNENDRKEVLFTSVHGYGPTDPHGRGMFYPGSGPTHFPAISEENGEGTSQKGKDKKDKTLILDVGLPLVDSEVPGASRFKWRSAMRTDVLPRLAAFKPDLILISAGFDAHKKDVLNCGYIGVLEEDYAWITRHLVKMANTFCDGRIVSMLEGGYRVQGGIVSAFARSVAAHVRVLVEGCDDREIYDEEEINWEEGFESRAMAMKEKKINDMMMAVIAQRRREMLSKSEPEATPPHVPSPPPGSQPTDTAPSATTTTTTATKEEPTAPAPAPVPEERGGAASSSASSSAPVEGRRAGKRRAASNVDYVALAKKLKEEEEESSRPPK